MRSKRSTADASDLIQLDMSVAGEHAMRARAASVDVCVAAGAAELPVVEAFDLMNQAAAPQAQQASNEAPALAAAPPRVRGQAPV